VLSTSTKNTMELDRLSLMPVSIPFLRPISSDTQNTDSIISRAHTPMRLLAHQALRERLCCRNAFGEHWIALAVRELPANQLSE
jgi:hypothetical protein